MQSLGTHVHANIAAVELVMSDISARRLFIVPPIIIVVSNSMNSTLHQIS